MIPNKTILTRILTGTPVSIVRFGDGESICLNAMSSVGAMELAATAVLRRQLGFDPTVQQVKEVRENLIVTYSTADYIGVSNHKQKVDGHWQKSLSILNHNVPTHTPNYFDIDMAYQWLQDDSYLTLLDERLVLNYISCRDLDDGFKSVYHIDTVNKFTIAPEAKFTSGYDGDPHYPTQFNRIPRWLDVMAERHPGSLLLVGAGVIGKIYCNWWRDRGGVAVDLGGVFDCWAGRVTRGPERGLDKVDLTHSLLK